MEPFSTPRTEPHQLLTLLGTLPAQAPQPPLCLSFLQAQLPKQFLQKLASRKDQQGFYLSCTAPTLNHVGNPERELWLLRVSWGGKCGHAKQTKVRVLAGGKAMQRNQILYQIWGRTTHFSQARRVQSQDGAVAMCFPKASCWHGKCRLFLKGGLPLPSHTSSLQGKERSPPAPWQ